MNIKRNALTEKPITNKKQKIATLFEEVIRGKEKGRKDSILMERLVNENKIKLRIPNESIKNKNV